MTDSYGIPDQLFGRVPGSFYAMVGRVTMLGALLEQRLLELLWAVDDEPQAVHAGKSVALLLKLIDERLGDLPEEAAGQTRDVLGRVRAAAEERNPVVHSLWPDPTMAIALRWRPRTAARRMSQSDWLQGEFVTRHELRDVITRLVAIDQELATCAQGLHSRRGLSMGSGHRRIDKRDR